MKSIAKLLSIISMVSLAAPCLVNASPQSDLKEFQEYFLKRFPDVKLDGFADGMYALSKERREEWLAMEEFPPYEPGLAIGKQLFEKYKIGECFKQGGIGIRQHYPYFDVVSGKIKNLEGEILECLQKKGVDLEKEKFDAVKGKTAAISAYMAYTSRGKKFNITIPDDPRALAAYERGKHHFWSKRGQLNFACADCHLRASGQLIRSNLLSAALGHGTGFPVYRKTWEAEDTSSNSALAGFGTLHRRYEGCNEQVRAKKFKAQSDEYMALELYESYMSTGVPISGPSIRE
ncbi:MAG: sulfur oxidation c-type cytochrome SoxA [Gammaproteobacteria bacterium]|nr:sulfur oxidation c-type cytochrome SoxA [Gammaproteobacteria bacterium]